MDERIRMKAWRVHLGYTKLQYAQALGVWPSVVTMWERDEYTLRPQRHHIEKLCEIAKISPQRFYFGALPKPKKHKQKGAAA